MHRGCGGSRLCGVVQWCWERIVGGGCGVGGDSYGRGKEGRLIALEDHVHRALRRTVNRSVLGMQMWAQLVEDEVWGGKGGEGARW